MKCTVDVKVKQVYDFNYLNDKEEETKKNGEPKNWREPEQWKTVNNRKISLKKRVLDSFLKSDFLSQIVGKFIHSWRKTFLSRTLGMRQTENAGNVE